MHLFRRADELDEDPLHGSLVGQMADLPAGHPGCLVAAYCYQDRLFDREVRDLYTSAMPMSAFGVDRKTFTRREYFRVLTPTLADDSESELWRTSGRDQSRTLLSRAFSTSSASPPASYAIHL